MPEPGAARPAGVIVIPPGEGRRYACGPMHSVFLADGAETGDRYSASSALNVFIPGGFEANMPGIVEWYRAQSEGAPVTSAEAPRDDSPSA